VPQCADPLPGIKTGCIFEPFWEERVVVEPSAHGGTNWPPVPYSPDTGYFYVPGIVRTSAFVRIAKRHSRGEFYIGGGQDAVAGTPLAGTFTAIHSKTNKIVWQHKTPYQTGGAGGSTVTASALLVRGDPDGNFLAIDAKTGEVLWRFQTGFAADAPPIIYEIDGEEYIAIVTGGNAMRRSATGDAVWAFSLMGQLGPAWWPPRPPATVAGPGLWWSLWYAVSSLWQGHGNGAFLEEPSRQVPPGDRGDR
jgi:alcohol dehydrogenase (cytochrome c)